MNAMTSKSQPDQRFTVKQEFLHLQARKLESRGPDAPTLCQHPSMIVGKFPIIRDHAHQRNLPESSIIIEYLDRLYPGTHRLIPDDWESALEVRLWDRFFDHYVQVPLQQIVSDRLHATNGDLTRERSTLETAYGMLDRRMASRIWVASPQRMIACRANCI